MGKKNDTQRNGEKFNSDMEDVKEYRVEEGIDKKKKSMRILTNKLTGHKLWPKIMQDLKEVEIDDQE